MISQHFTPQELLSVSHERPTSGRHSFLLHTETKKEDGLNLFAVARKRARRRQDGPSDENTNPTMARQHRLCDCHQRGLRIMDLPKLFLVRVFPIP